MTWVWVWAYCIERPGHPQFLSSPCQIEWGCWFPTLVILLRQKPYFMFCSSYVYHYCYFCTTTHLPSTMQIKCYSVCLFDSLPSSSSLDGFFIPRYPGERTQNSILLWAPSGYLTHAYASSMILNQTKLHIAKVRCWYPLPGSWSPAILPIRQLGSMVNNNNI